ncbi:hypothetical protein [[Limnothrix rosea] IAM M-220]|uniref:hypothetical protein n=1 Tax=[Limnothrix rosea] IAM M-220 TaxID=454133 RepID=UPI0015C52614|nr:hypothetical protein [[Limnothrix rosea] IAM M-220]
MLIWLVLFLLGSSYFFTEVLTLWPDFLLVKVSQLFGWFCLWAIAGFVLWCFAEE